MADTKQVEIPEIRLARIVVTIKGVTPLLTNRFSEKALMEIANKQEKKAKGIREARDPEADARGALHVIDEANGVYGFPAGGMKKALLAAGYRFGGERMVNLAGLINIVGDPLIPIKSKGYRIRQDWVSPSSMKGAASIAYRPEFFPWEMDVPITYAASGITKDQVINLFMMAGFSVGIGAWRVEKKGIHGQFEVLQAVEH